jgi:hypothetical protein
LKNWIIFAESVAAWICIDIGSHWAFAVGGKKVKGIDIIEESLIIIE